MLLLTNGTSIATALDVQVGGGDADDGGAEHIALAINSNTAQHGVPQQRERLSMVLPLV